MEAQGQSRQGEPQVGDGRRTKREEDLDRGKAGRRTTPQHLGWETVRRGATVGRRVPRVMARSRRLQLQTPRASHRIRQRLRRGPVLGIGKAEKLDLWILSRVVAKEPGTLGYRHWCCEQVHDPEAWRGTKTGAAESGLRSDQEGQKTAVRRVTD